ncbi:MAG: permease [Clostridia bacterium]|nr:permease [Clostridiaceae bacterium]OQB53598.1 MAG: putative permease [Firmicutes bacterium ADurb.Bin146]
MTFTYVLYALALIGLTLSLFKDKNKTKMALKKAWKSFENILPQFLSILVIIGIVFAVLSPETITMLLGSNSGFLGVIGASLIGAITLIPGFVAFPLAAALLNSGAGYMQITAFVASLMMVGIVTLPLEIKTFGKKAAIIRNVSAYVFSLIAALIMGVLL